MPNYVPIISPRLTSILEANPELASGCDAELVAAATRHAGKANLTLSNGEAELSRLDCVGIETLAPHADHEKILSIVSTVFPQAEQVFIAYSGNQQMLDEIAERRNKEQDEQKEKLFLIYNHIGLITGAMGAACLLAAMYEKEVVKPGEIDLNIVLGTTTKRLNIAGVPVAEALVRDGIFQYIDFVVPRSYSTVQSSALQKFQNSFNSASMRVKVERNRNDTNNSIIEVIHPSASTDKKVTINGKSSYHLAPGHDSASIVSRGYCLPLGLAIKSNGEPSIYIGNMQPPARKREHAVDALDIMMRGIADGMNAVHDTSCVYHDNEESYLGAINCTTAV